MKAKLQRPEIPVCTGNSRHCLDFKFVPGEKYDIIVSAGSDEPTAKDDAERQATPPASKSTASHAQARTRTGPGRLPPRRSLEHLRPPAFSMQCEPERRCWRFRRRIRCRKASQSSLLPQVRSPITAAVGDFRAPWMGNWYFVREHALFAGMPVEPGDGWVLLQDEGPAVERSACRAGTAWVGG